MVMNAPSTPPTSSPAVAAVVPAPSPEVAATIKSITPASSLGAKLKSAALAALTPAAPARQSLPQALRSPDATEGVDTFTPFAFGDFTWLNGQPRNKAPVFDTKFFTPDIRFD